MPDILVVRGFPEPFQERFPERFGAADTSGLSTPGLRNRRVL
ncbi:hypothetical protein [Streptomyces sp. NPDC060205]